MHLTLAMLGFLHDNVYMLYVACCIMYVCSHSKFSSQNGWKWALSEVKFVDLETQQCSQFFLSQCRAGKHAIWEQYVKSFRNNYTAMLENLANTIID